MRIPLFWRPRNYLLIHLSVQKTLKICWVPRGPNESGGFGRHMTRGSSGRAARRGGRVAVPTKRALQSGVTDDTSNKKQAVGGGGAGPSSAPVSLTPAEGAPADGAATGRLPSSAPVSQISGEGACAPSPELEASSSESREPAPEAVAAVVVSGSAVPVAPQAVGDVMAAVVVSTCSVSPG